MGRKEIIFLAIGGILVLISLYTLFFIEDLFLTIISIVILIAFIPASLIFFKKEKSGTKEEKKTTHDKELKREEEVRLNKTGNGFSGETPTEERLYELSAVFPFDLFPNRVIIGQRQVVIIYKQFFLTSQVIHLLIEDILTPIAESSIFFATLRLELGAGGYQQNPPPVRFLKKGEALKARRIIMGLLMFIKEDVDLEGLTPQEIAKKAEESGRFKS